MKLIDKRKFVKELEKYQWQTPKDIPMLMRIRNCLNTSEIYAIPLSTIETKLYELKHKLEGDKNYEIMMMSLQIFYEMLKEEK